jgi:hypothetical protein
MICTIYVFMSDVVEVDVVEVSNIDDADVLILNF